MSLLLRRPPGREAKDSSFQFLYCTFRWLFIVTGWGHLTPKRSLSIIRRSKTSSFPQLVPQTPTTRKAETDSNQSTTIHERIPSSYRPTRYAGSPLPLISQVGNGSGWLATTSRNEEVFHVGFNTKARQQATNNHLSDSPVTAGLRPRTRRKGTP
ncbi:hypothetical protein V6N13_014886 [Hibiscus sabdariffa]